jgi:hypothetical protein
LVGSKPIVIGVAVVAVAGLLAWLSFSPRPAPPPAPVLTPEARAYLPNLNLSDVQPQTSESYIQKSLFEIMGKITNSGNRVVTSVRVKCVFRDYYGKELKRELATVVSARGPLAAGATKAFRLAFDDIPDSWNQQMPDFVIAEIGF